MARPLRETALRRCSARHQQHGTVEARVAQLGKLGSVLHSKVRVRRNEHDEGVPYGTNSPKVLLFYECNLLSDLELLLFNSPTNVLQVKAQLKMEIADPLMCATARVQDYPAEMARVYEYCALHLVFLFYCTDMRVNRKAEREGKPIKMFQVVLESSSEVVYKSIKAVMTSMPVQTQCVQQKTIKPQADIESKVKGLLQQMVCKLGGAPWGCVDLLSFPSLFSSQLNC